jgi:hypothetical protein
VWVCVFIFIYIYIRTEAGSSAISTTQFGVGFRLKHKSKFMYDSGLAAPSPQPNYV